MDGKKLTCHWCKTPMGTLRDARTRKGMVVFCAHCAETAGMYRRAALDRRDDDKFVRDFFGGMRKPN